MTASFKTSSAQAHNRQARQVTAELTAALLSHAISDVEVVSRELLLSPKMIERMRRALDCLQCLEVILETEANGRIDVEAEVWAAVVGLVRGYLEAWPDDHLGVLVGALIEGSN